jgi:hypothetical protein
MVFFGNYGTIADLFDGSYEPVASPGDRFNVPGFAGGLTQSSAQDENILGQVVLLDVLIRPKLVHEDILVDNVTAVSNEDEKCEESLGRQMYELPFPQQDTLSYIQTKRAEAVKIIS